ncbi:hypothetical protein ACH0BO_07485 [Brevibacterium luteolum]|uniref:hypothetical protein n=1 Tax=Brevibacterium luteolum TaxID=199591 RepID=UPI00387A6B11
MSTETEHRGTGRAAAFLTKAAAWLLGVIVVSLFNSPNPVPAVLSGGVDSAALTWLFVWLGLTAVIAALIWWAAVHTRSASGPVWVAVAVAGEVLLLSSVYAWPWFTLVGDGDLSDFPLIPSRFPLPMLGSIHVVGALLAALVRIVRRRRPGFGETLQIREQAVRLRADYAPSTPMPWTEEGQQLDEPPGEFSADIDLFLESFDQVLVGMRELLGESQLEFLERAARDVRNHGETAVPADREFAGAVLELIEPCRSVRAQLWARDSS